VSPWRLHNFTSWFFRDHKKMLIIDNQVAHTGGIGIHQLMSTWRDTNVRLTGYIVTEFERLFAKTLEIARKKRFVVVQNSTVNGSDFQFLISSPFLRNLRSFKYRKRYLRDMYIQKIENATSYAYFTTPYFVPDFKFFHVLQKAAKRGIDVRILLPITSDFLSLDLAAASYFGLALAAGIKVFRYKPGLVHAKTAVIDDTWATIGSANLDNLSFWFCYEANVISNNFEFNRQLKQQFLSDLENSEEVKPFAWGNRPWRQKILELLTWPAHNFM
jgi:cardiolipin synthase